MRKLNSSQQFLFSSSRAVWCRKNYSWFCFRGVPCFPRHSLLFSWRWQYSSWPEQESGFHNSRQRREHPPYCRGGQAVCWCWLGLHHKLHLSFCKGMVWLNMKTCSACVAQLVRKSSIQVNFSLCSTMMPKGPKWSKEDPRGFQPTVFWGVCKCATGGVWEQGCQRAL